MELLALRALLGLSCAAPILFMAWRLRGQSWCAARWVTAMLVFGLSSSGDPLSVALRQVDGLMVRSLCGN